MHIAKKGLRVLGIAESFSSREYSILAGVVMRKDLRIDGVALSRITVGGNDATEGVLSIYRSLRRRDINVIMVSGCVVAWFNILDPASVFRETGVPVIVVTYEDSEGLAPDICRHFPGDSRRLACYESLGERIPCTLHTGYTVYIRPFGLNTEDSFRLCQDFARDGKVPEPLRVARLVARSVMRIS